MPSRKPEDTMALLDKKEEEEPNMQSLFFPPPDDDDDKPTESATEDTASLPDDIETESIDLASDDPLPSLPQNKTYMRTIDQNDFENFETGTNIKSVLQAGLAIVAFPVREKQRSFTGLPVIHHNDINKTLIKHGDNKFTIEMNIFRKNDKKNFEKDIVNVLVPNPIKNVNENNEFNPTDPENPIMSLLTDDKKITLINLDGNKGELELDVEGMSSKTVKVNMSSPGVHNEGAFVGGKIKRRKTKRRKTKRRKTKRRKTKRKKTTRKKTKKK